MANLKQLAIDSKSELLSEQIPLYVERAMERELRMTRLLTDLCHEVTEAVKDKVNLIEEVKELGGRASTSDSMAYLRILCGEDMEKAKDIMKLIKETQAHNHGKYAFIAKTVVIFAKGNKLLEISVCLCYLMFYCLGNVGAGDVF
ncbi:hypothetical protein Tco_0742837 [Tanacetum coccineum]